MQLHVYMGSRLCDKQSLTGYMKQIPLIGAIGVLWTRDMEPLAQSCPGG